MRWKWLLVLSLISISLVVVSGDDDVKTEKVEDVDDNYEDEKITDETVVTDESLTDAPADDNDLPEDEGKVDQVVDEQEPTNEDTVDVDVAVEKQKGKYVNYDDYFVASALDGSDSGYDWNGELNLKKENSIYSQVFQRFFEFQT